MFICTDASSYIRISIIPYAYVDVFCCCAYISFFWNRSLFFSVVKARPGMGDWDQADPKLCQEGSAALGAGWCGLGGTAGTCSVSGWDWPLWGTQQRRETEGAFPPICFVKVIVLVQVVLLYCHCTVSLWWSIAVFVLWCYLCSIHTIYANRKKGYS